MARLILILVVSLGILVRIFQFNHVPYALNPDETALGYTAFSLLKTGADEHGKAFPLMFESFGDWKMPVYAYLTVIPVAILGLTETAVRLVSLLSGVGSIILLYFVTRKLFKNEKIALIAGLFIAISPWSIFFSRMAIEANLANFIFLLGFLFYLKNKLLTSFILFGLTMFCYHTFLIFAPIFVAGIFLSNFRYLKLTKSLFFGSLIFLFLLISSWFMIKSSASSKLTDVGFWNNNDVLYNRVLQFRKSESSTFDKLLHNKYSGLAYHLAENYISSYNPSFLFDKGGQKILHNTGFSGVLLLSDALFLIAGLLFLLKTKPLAVKIILLWILAAPISSSLTLDHPSSTRLFAASPALIMLGAFGAYKLSKFYKIVSVIFLSFFISVIFLFWLDGYFNFLNVKRAQFMGAGFKQAAEYVKKFPNFHVIWTKAQDFPYIYVLFYNKIDPREFQKDVTYFPRTPEGFMLVKSFGRFSFPSNLNDPSKSEPIFKNNTIYIESFGVHSNSKSINLPSGDPRFLIYVSTKNGH